MLSKNTLLINGTEIKQKKRFSLKAKRILSSYEFTTPVKVVEVDLRGIKYKQTDNYFFTN